MKRSILLITTFVFIFSLGLFAQQQTSDGGYIIGGITDSYTHGFMDYDFLVYKLNASGAKQWRKNYGGSNYDVFSAVIQTADGGYAACGHSRSYTHGEGDFLVYKLDENGSKLWRKNFGGMWSDECFAIVQTADGGFAISGNSTSYTNGNLDFLVYRLNAAGQKLWRKNYGGIEHEWGGFIDATSDGGFIICGTTQSYSNGQDDFLVYKLDAAGTKQWRKNFGGEETDSARSVRQTADGGFIVAGYGRSFTSTSLLGRAAFPHDYLVYKLDASGKKQWRKCYGGSDQDRCYDVRLTADGGYIILGESKSYGYDEYHYDFLCYKLNVDGRKLWRKNYGGMYNDYGYRIWPTSDGGFLLVGDGNSYSQTGGDRDILIYKVNSAGTKQWRKNYGGTGSDFLVAH